MDTPARIAELERKFVENPRRYFAALANEYRKNGELERAIELCQRHLAEQRNHLSGHVVLAQSLVDAGREQDAWDSLHTALDLDPENVIALRLLGDLCAHAGETEQAREYYFRALDIEPRNEELTRALKSLAPRRAPEPAEPATTAAGKEVGVSEESELEGPGDRAELPSWRDAELPAWVSPAEEEPQTVQPDEAAEAEPEPATSGAGAEPTDRGEPPSDIWDFPQEPEPTEQPAAVAATADDHSRETPEIVQDVSEHVEPPGEDAGEWYEAATEVRAAAPEGPGAEEQIPEEVESPVADELDLEPLELMSVSEATVAEEYREPERAPEPRPTLASETMVDLYLQQGHTELALAALRELAADRPNDERLTARLEELERSTAQPPKQTVRDLFARLGRRRAPDSEAAAALAGAFASLDERGPLAEFFARSQGDPSVRPNEVLAAVLTASDRDVRDRSFDQWLQDQRPR